MFQIISLKHHPKPNTKKRTKGSKCENPLFIGPDFHSAKHYWILINTYGLTLRSAGRPWFPFGCHGLYNSISTQRLTYCNFTKYGIFFFQRKKLWKIYVPWFIHGQIIKVTKLPFKKKMKEQIIIIIIIIWFQIKNKSRL